MARKSFTNRTELIEFDVDGDVFYAAPEAPAETLLELAASAEGLTGIEQYRMLGSILDMVLVPESAKRFGDRMKDPEHPIGLASALDVVAWLVEEYTGRPTEGSASSPESSAPPEASSEDGLLLSPDSTPGG